MNTYNIYFHREIRQISISFGLYSKTGVYRGIYYFSYFSLKKRLWVLI